MWDYQHPYKGGTPTVKHPLPRPLYPPDANEHGKKPSVDGPDVLAWKRSLSRGGRWCPWDPESWDDSFSNAVSHGRGPDVADSGCEGFQRQMRISNPTGWIGTSSWDALRYALVPDGLPHAGEHLIDGVAQELFQEAWDRFGGHPPDDQGLTLRKRALQRATSQLGYAEGANNSNKYGAWYGLDHNPWCAMFCCWSFENEGDSPAFVRGERFSYVPYIVSDARACKNGLTTVGVDDVIAGDLVCYDWQFDGTFDHVGIFEKWIGDEFYAVEGNTSSTSQSNGGSVQRRDRLPSAQSTVFVRVAEP